MEQELEATERAPQETAPKTRKKMTKKQKINLIFIWSMLLIPIVQWIIFYLYVNMDSFVLAFREVSGKWTMNYMNAAWHELTTGGSTLLSALGNTLIYFVKDVLMIPFQLVIAYFLYKEIAGSKFFRIMFYLPSLISGVVMVTVYSALIAPYGAVGQLIEAVFGNCPSFLADSRYATWAIVFYTIWLGWGGNMLIFGGSLARIPTEMFEAARLDGITASKELIYLILPLMWPTLSTILILNLTGLFGAGGPILLFDSAKLNVGIDTLGYWMFEKVWKNGAAAYNEVSATGLILTLIGAPAILLIRWGIERVPKVEY